MKKELRVSHATSGIAASSAKPGNEPSLSRVDQLVSPAKPFSLPTQRMSGPASLKITATQGSKDVVVALDGKDVDKKGRVQVKPIVQFPVAKISVRAHFIHNGAATEYRFDGKVS